MAADMSDTMNGMTDDLVAFLRARLDEDEQVARAATGEEWGAVNPSQPYVIFDVDAFRENKTLESVGRLASVERAEDRAHIARHDPARVLADIHAKRRAIAPYAAALEERGPLRDRIRAVLHKDHKEFARLHRQESELIETERRYRPIVQALALPYADHPHYRQEWRP
jgi:hypothetical protein